jgi:membrane protein YdbS with pleckstrin-like domain
MNGRTYSLHILVTHAISYGIGVLLAFAITRNGAFTIGALFSLTAYLVIVRLVATPETRS